MKFRIAEKTFNYEPLPEWRKMHERAFQDFRIPDTEMAEISIPESEMEKNREILRHRNYPSLPEEIETGALQITLMDMLRPCGNLLIHSAVVVVDGEAYAFTGPSGIGKSTQCELWKRHFRDRAFILNGDKSFYHRESGRWQVYGTPWKGKEGIGVNGRAPLRAIFFLSQGTGDSLKKFGGGSEEMERLMPQTYLPRTEEEMDVHLQQVEQFAEEVAAYSLSCTPQDTAVTLAYGAVNPGA